VLVSREKVSKKEKQKRTYFCKETHRVGSILLDYRCLDGELFFTRNRCLARISCFQFRTRRKASG